MKKRMILILPLMMSMAAVSFGSGSGVEDMLAARGLFLTLALVFAGGVAVSLTPCLYPMIPITLSIIGARSAGQKPILGFLRSLVFVLGIAVVYTALGFFVARTGGTVGFLFQNKWFVMGVAVLFVAMGLAMMDYFTIQMPASISGRLQSGANRGGFVGAFLLGLVTGVVASPCGSPVLVGVLGIAAQSGRAGVGVSLLFAYAMGIGLLFLLLGTFPAFLGRMPKSGVWMEDVKKLLGLVMLGVAVYYVNTIMPDTTYWVMVALLSVAAGVFLLERSGSRRAFPKLLVAWRVAAVLLLATGAYAGFWRVPVTVSGVPASAVAAVVPTGDGTTATQALDGGAPAVPGKLVWLTSEEEGIAQLKATGKPMMVDFTAAWCAACKQLERDTFSNPDVRAALADFVLVKIDLTEESPEGAALQKKYKSMSLPTVAFVTPDGKILDNLTLYAFESPAKFLERLAKVRQ